MKDDRYRSPKLAKITCSEQPEERVKPTIIKFANHRFFLMTLLTMMSLPLFSALLATLMAATAAAPDDIPT
jgi:hypothetical protein